MDERTGLLEIDEEELDEELEALTINLLAEDKDWFITQKQVFTLVILFNAGLQDVTRNNRLAVMRLLCQEAVTKRTGYLIKSTKQIPGSFAAVLIDLLGEKVNGKWELSNYGYRLLLLAEARAKAGTT